MQENNDSVEDVGLRERIEVEGGEREKPDDPSQNAIDSFPGFWHFPNGRGGSFRLGPHSGLSPAHLSYTATAKRPE